MFGKHPLVLFGLAIVVALAALSAVAQTDSPAGATVQNELTERDTPYHYSSGLGDFQVTWPGGCGRLQIRTNQIEPRYGDEYAEAAFVHHVVCDRDTLAGEGCSVTATFDATDGEGGLAGPEQVLERVRETMQNFGVKVVNQRPLKRGFENGRQIEGVEVQGTGADGQGEFWVRGLLYDHNIYVLLAWSARSELWDNVEFQAFFNEFLPYAE